jgi:hypothetical protein
MTCEECENSLACICFRRLMIKGPVVAGAAEQEAPIMVVEEGVPRVPGCI